MDSPNLGDYLRLFALYDGGKENDFHARDDMRLLFAQVMLLLTRTSRFNREMPLPVLLVAHQLRRGGVAVQHYFHSAENQCFFLNDLFRYLDMQRHRQEHHSRLLRESGWR